jgi:threonine 3-dehydrogenase
MSEHKAQLMKALVKAKSEEGLWMQDIDIPEPGFGEVRVKIEKTAICGTDVHIYKWDDWAKQTIPVPMAIGHEFFGRIEKLGQGVDEAHFKLGAGVSGEGHITCGQCRNCRAGSRHLCPKTLGIGVNRSGAFAEYLCMPSDNICLIPDDIDADHAAIMDPLGNAVHTALSFDLVGEDVLITGAGPIGLMAISVAKHVGARHVAITDVNPYRLAIAESLGAVAVDISKENLLDVMSRLGMEEGFDIGLEMSGQVSALNNIIDHASHGAKIAQLGIFKSNVEMPINEMIMKGITIKGIYGREMFETWYKMMSMIQSGLNLSSIITHQFVVDDFQKGFDLLLQGKAGKVILNWV